MLEKWLVSIVIAFVMRQFAKFRDQLDWDKVRLDLETRVKDLVPGSWFDDEAVMLVDLVLAKLKSALGDSEAIGKLLTLLASSDWPGALVFIKGLLSAALPTATEVKLAAALAA